MIRQVPSAAQVAVSAHECVGAQSAEEVAEVIVSTIEKPRADVYTRPEGQKVIVSYYAAEDMAEAEKAFGPPRRP